MKKLLCECSAVIEAPPHKVRERLRAQTGWTESTENVLAMQGGWWYRGEFTLEPHAQGTLLTHRVFNVAAWGRWAVPLANRFFIGFTETTRNGFAQGVSAIGEALECRVRVL